jgi:hypothetical protein
MGAGSLSSVGKVIASSAAVPILSVLPWSRALASPLTSAPATVRPAWR